MPEIIGVLTSRLSFIFDGLKYDERTKEYIAQKT